jgi:hypothetical protein
MAEEASRVGRQATPTAHGYRSWSLGIGHFMVDYLDPFDEGSQR